MDRLPELAPSGESADTPMAQASRAVREAASDLTRRRLEPDPRRPVRALDLLLDELERFNLAGGALTSSPDVLDWLGQVQAAVGTPVPGWVLAVPDTVRLHAAMLRWQGTLLNACHPERDQLGDLHDDLIDLLLLSPAPAAVAPNRARVRRQVA
ncbi:MAG TPA: hypothetical protein VFC09_14380 [Candidatus Dormibacteraeota bacterium]|nr:hypothetical protein [Candidatus Dormibacteraeota bacterium]